MAVGVLAAMPSELRPFVRGGGLQRRGNGSVWVGPVGRHTVRATTMGVGMVGAERAAQQLLADGDLSRIVVVGIAGGLDPALPIAHVLVPEVVVDGATDAEYRTTPWADLEMRGRLVTFDSFQTDPEVIAALRRQGYAAIDMETAAVASVCAKQGCAFTAFRAISDNATDGSVDPAVAAMARPDGSPDVPAALRYILRRPWRLPRLAVLGRDAQRASKAAAAAAIAALDA